MKINYSKGLLRVYLFLAACWTIFSLIYFPLQLSIHRSDVADKIRQAAFTMNAADAQKEIKYADKITDSARFMTTLKEEFSVAGALIILGPIAAAGVIGYFVLHSTKWIARGFTEQRMID